MYFINRLPKYQSSGKSKHVGFEIKSNRYKIPSNLKSDLQIMLSNHINCQEFKMYQQVKFFFRTLFLPHLGFYHDTGTLRALRSLCTKGDAAMHYTAEQTHVTTGQCDFSNFKSNHIFLQIKYKSLSLLSNQIKSNQQITQITRN